MGLIQVCNGESKCLLQTGTEPPSSFRSELIQQAIITVAYTYTVKLV